MAPPAPTEAQAQRHARIAPAAIGTPVVHPVDVDRSAHLDADPWVHIVPHADARQRHLAPWLGAARSVADPPGPGLPRSCSARLAAPPRPALAPRSLARRRWSTCGPVAHAAEQTDHQTQNYSAPPHGHTPRSNSLPHRWRRPVRRHQTDAPRAPQSALHQRPCRPAHPARRWPEAPENQTGWRPSDARAPRSAGR